MCRLRRQKLEVVVPLAQGQKYRPTPIPALNAGAQRPPLRPSGEKVPEGRMRGGLDSDQGGLTPHDQHPEHAPIQARPASESAPDSEDTDDDADDDGDETDEPTRGKKTKVEWIEAIPPGCFYLRVGLGRKASGSYYTPHSFVRFLVQETLGPQVEERSPQNDPKPLEILKLRVLDPAMG